MTGMGNEQDEGKSAFWGQVGALARKLGGAGVTAHPPAAPAPVAAGQRTTSVDPLVAFARRVRAVLADGATASAGAIYIVNLTKVRELLMAEGRWDRLADRVQNICLQMIRQRLEPADMFHCLPGPIFLIVFAHLSLDAAKLKCAVIAEEIGQRLTGCDPKFKDVMVGAAMAGLSKNDVALNLTYLMAEAERVIADGQAGVTAGLDSEATDPPHRAFDNPWLVEDRSSEVLRGGAGMPARPVLRLFAAVARQAPGHRHLPLPAGPAGQPVPVAGWRRHLRLGPGRLAV